MGILQGGSLPDLAMALMELHVGSWKEKPAFPRGEGSGLDK